MWLVMISRGALACSTLPTVVGFADWVDGAVDVPTDARVVIEANVTLPVTFTRPDTGEVVEAAAGVALNTPTYTTRIAYGPVSPLAPGVAWRADVTDYDGVTRSATFTTGAGPTPAGFAAPALSDIGASTWESAESLTCLMEGDLVARDVTGALAVPDGLPVGAYVGLRTAAQPWLYAHLQLAADGDFALVQHEFANTSDAQRAGADCLTPVLILPSGVEIAGAEVCAPPPPAGDTGDTDAPADTGHAKGGCATGGVAGSWALALVALGLAGRRSAGARRRIQ